MAPERFWTEFRQAIHVRTLRPLFDAQDGLVCVECYSSPDHLCPECSNLLCRPCAVLHNLEHWGFSTLDPQVVFP